MHETVAPSTTIAIATRSLARRAHAEYVNFKWKTVGQLKQNRADTLKSQYQSTFKLMFRMQRRFCFTPFAALFLHAHLHSQCDQRVNPFYRIFAYDAQSEAG